jgi:hypothetical protein
MDAHDPRDLDGVIDDVARNMTSEGLARDLRPAIAARLASAPSWTAGWRVGVAAAAMAAVALVAAVMWSGLPPDAGSERAPSSAAAGRSGPETAAPAGPHSAGPASAESLAAAARPEPARVVVRQTIDVDQPADDAVEITPLAIVPLEDSDDEEITLMSHSVEIAPIDVEPLRISEIEQVE